VFHTASVLVALCRQEASGPAGRELLRPQREARRLVTAQGKSGAPTSRSDTAVVDRDLVCITTGRGRSSREGITLA
jgi:hypothetical protein